MSCACHNSSQLVLLTPTHSPQVLQDLQIKTAAYLYAEEVLRQKIPEDVYKTEQPMLREQFMDGLLDADLLCVVKEERGDWALEGLPSFAQVLKRCEVRSAVEMRKLQSALAAKAASANMDVLCADLDQDTQEVKLYMQAVEKAKAERDRRVCRYKRQRYEDGQYQVKELMKQRCAFVDIPSAVHVSREVGEMRRTLEQDVAPKGQGSALVMLYLDLNISHDNNTLTALTEAVKLLHQTPNIGICVRWLVRHQNNNADMVVKTNRKVEDTLLKAGIAIADAPSTLLFDPSTLHKKDLRPLSALFSVGVSSQYGNESLWMQTTAARGHLGTSPLVRPCQMAAPACKARGVPGDPMKLNPAQRAQQLGTEAHLALLNGLVVAALEEPDDVGSGGGAPSHCRKALVVQVQPGDFGELGHAVLKHILSPQTAASAPMALSYKGIFVGYGATLEENSPDRGVYPVDGGMVATTLPLSRVFEGRLLSEWWDNHPSAGPRDGLVSEGETAVTKPTLRVCTWEGDVPVVVPEAAMRFTPGSEAAEEWKKRVQEFTKLHGAPPHPRRRQRAPTSPRRG